MSSPASNLQPPAPLLEVRDLKKYFPIKKGLFSRTVGHVKALDGISFDVYPGEVLGLVGESGCGKTTAGRSILQLIPPTSGSVRFEGQELVGLSRAELRPLRRQMQIVFQDPYSSLNPRLTVGSILREALTTHNLAKGRAADDRVSELLSLVGLSPTHAVRYPHEFSGGQRQRIGIARALAVSPRLIVADEPVSALDVSIQAQVLNILRELQRDFGLTYLFIAHNLSVVEHFSERVGVMYLGKMVEMAPRDLLYADPLHPYTQALMSAIPVPDPTVKRQRILLEGDVPSPLNPPPGCRFHTRCPLAFDLCRQEEPPFKDYGGGHYAACHWLETGQRGDSKLTPANIAEKKGQAVARQVIQ